MTREEMIAKARETRKQVTNRPVPPELLAQYPAAVECITIDTPAGSVPVYDTRPETVAPGAPLVIYFHGGGFIRERTPNDEVLCRRLACALGLRILDVDYSIAPDYPFPQAVNESYGVFSYVRENAARFGAVPERIILMGASAGGNLVCTVNLLCKEQGVPGPMLNILAYPPLDIATDPGEKKYMGEGIPPERARLYNLYYAEAEQQRDPLVSPVYAAPEQLTGFAPTLVMTAGQDVLCNEAEDFGLMLARSGVSVTMKRFPAAKHGFIVYRTDCCDEGIDYIADFIRKHW